MLDDSETWRFHYGRKLTPERISGFLLPRSSALEKWVESKLAELRSVVSASLAPYSNGDDAPSWYGTIHRTIQDDG